MKQQRTEAIVLSRTDFGEADRIAVVLTPSYGKLRLMVKGARKVKSKLAGGIELFSVSDISFIHGKGDIGTLISARLDDHYGKIVKDINRVKLGYDLINLINKVTEDQTEAHDFDLLNQALAALNDFKINLNLIRTWFEAQLLKRSGHGPNLSTDTLNKKLQASGRYNFDIEAMTFSPQPNGKYRAQQIKALRLLFSQHQPNELQNVQGLSELSQKLSPLIGAMLSASLRV